VHWISESQVRQKSQQWPVKVAGVIGIFNLSKLYGYLYQLNSGNANSLCGNKHRKKVLLHNCGCLGGSHPPGDS